MNGKKLCGVVIVLLAIAVTSFAHFEKTTQPTTIITTALWDPEVLNISYLVDNAETIPIGRVKEVLPSKWNTFDGKKPQKLEKAIIYTDVIIEVQQYILRIHKLAEKL